MDWTMQSEQNVLNSIVRKLADAKRNLRELELQNPEDAEEIYEIEMGLEWTINKIRRMVPGAAHTR